MKTHIRRARPAFTLVEVLVVMTIIAILAGLVVVGMEFAKQRQASEKAKVQIALLSKGIEEYKADMGFYPGTYPRENPKLPAATESGGDYSKTLYTYLFYDGYNYAEKGQPADWSEATKIYLPELNPATTKQGWVTTSKTPSDSLNIMDPWGGNYLYRVGALADGKPNPNAQNPDFDLWSKGKDGKTNATSPDMTIDENKDDIRNF